MYIYDQFLTYIQQVWPYSEADLEVVRRHTVVRKLRKRQNLTLTGDVAKYAGWVGSGCMRLYQQDDDGTERIIEFAMEGQWVADRMSMLTGAPSPYVIEAVSDSEVLLFQLEGVDAICAEVPDFYRLVLSAVEGVLASYQTRVLMVQSMQAADKYRWLREQNPQLLLRVPQHMLASYLGITPATLSRMRAMEMP